MLSNSHWLEKLDLEPFDLNDFKFLDPDFLKFTLINGSIVYKKSICKAVFHFKVSTIPFKKDLKSKITAAIDRPIEDKPIEKTPLELLGKYLGKDLQIPAEKENKEEDEEDDDKEKDPMKEMIRKMKKNSNTSHHHEHESKPLSKDEFVQSLFSSIVISCTPPDKPFELIFRKGFSPNAVEKAILTSLPGEKSVFLLNGGYTDGFISLASVMKKEELARQGKPFTYSHCCSGALQDEYLLGPIITSTKGLPLMLEIECIKFLTNDQVVPESWQLTPMEKFNILPKLRANGVEQLRFNQLEEARISFGTALDYLTSISMIPQCIGLLTSESESDPIPPQGWILTRKEFLDARKSNRLNYSLVLLKLKHYRQTIDMCTKIIEEDDPKNVKAYFRRAQATRLHGIDLEKAEKDLEMIDAFGYSGNEIQEERNALKKTRQDISNHQRALYSTMFK